MNMSLNTLEINLEIIISIRLIINCFMRRLIYILILLLIEEPYNSDIVLKILLIAGISLILKVI
jgi:hypothetical protein